MRLPCFVSCGWKMLCGTGMKRHPNSTSLVVKLLRYDRNKYAPIEKEMCVILFACRKFHHYIFAKKTSVITDHKSLIGLFNKPLSEPSPRLQRMWMHVLHYDLQIHLEWKLGNEMFVPDTSSRFPSRVNNYKPEFNDTMEVSSVTRHLPVSDARLAEIRTKIVRNPELKLLREMIVAGWPTNRDLVPPQLLPYYPMRDWARIVRRTVRETNAPWCSLKDLRE